LVLAVITLTAAGYYSAFVDEDFGGDSGPIYFFVGAAVSYILQLIESMCSSTYRYVSNVESLKDTGIIIDKLKMTRPEIIFHIQNYHYETRTRPVTYTDDDGNSHTRYETYTERVNTHRAS
jgi:hypothetical protein